MIAARARRPTRALGAAALVVSALASALIPAAAHPAAAASPAIPRVTLIGDSTMAAMEWYTYDDEDADTIADDDIRGIVAAKYDLQFSAESCRRLVNPSCMGRFGERPVSVLPLIQSTLSGTLGDALVVMAGYDDSSIAGGVDAIMAEAERQGVNDVLWLNYRTATTYLLPNRTAAATVYQGNNLQLQQAAARHPRLHVIDWNTYSNGRTTWFASDGIHLTTDGAVGLARFIVASVDAQPTVSRCRAAAAHTGVPAGAEVAPPAADSAGAGFEPIVPTRVLDTRDPALGGGGNLGAGRTVAIDLHGDLPATATAAALTVTAVDTCRPGYVTVFPCGARPATSSLNIEIGRTTAGVAISAMTDQQVCLFASSSTDLAVDLVGSFTPTGRAFHPLTPTRWVDTRGGTALLTGIVGERVATSQTQVAVAGVGGVPANAAAVWINLTVADPTEATVLLAYPGPCGTAPLASTVNARALRSAASAALVGIGRDGSICVRTISGRSQMVIDVAGWFGSGDGGLLYQARPLIRLLDTRVPGSASGAPAAGREVSTPLGAVSLLNIAAVDSTGPGFVAVRPCGSSAVSSLINSSANEDTSNITAVGPGAAGGVCALTSNAAQVIIDLVGVFVPAAS